MGKIEYAGVLLAIHFEKGVIMGYLKILPPIFSDHTAEDYLKAALETDTWLQTFEIKTKEGRIWRRSPELEDRNVSEQILFTDKCMYGGSSGIGIYYLRLYEATGDERYLQIAKETADYIVTTYGGIDSYKEIEQIRSGKRPVGWATGPYNGPAGEAVFVELLYRAVPQSAYFDYVVRVADDLLTHAIKEESGIHWSEESDISGDGGLIAFLVLVYHRTKNEKYLKAASLAADFIAAKAVNYPGGGKYWDIFDTTRIGFAKGTIFPNFTHGTAGIGWIYAILYKETKREEYLQYAREATAFLQNIAVGDADGALIPHLYHPSTGPTKDLFYLSTCGGPVGTVHLYRQLYEITGEGVYLNWLRSLSRGIIRAGAPERNSWGYWQNSCLCCGSPGVLEHFVSVYELTGEREFLNYAKRTAAVLLGDSTITEGKRRWYGAWMRAAPLDVKSYTGLYIGTSGAAASLLKLYAVEKGKKISGFFEYLFDDETINAIQFGKSKGERK